MSREFVYLVHLRELASSHEFCHFRFLRIRASSCKLLPPARVHSRPVKIPSEIKFQLFTSENNDFKIKQGKMIERIFLSKCSNLATVVLHIKKELDQFHSFSTIYNLFRHLFYVKKPWQSSILY